MYHCSVQRHVEGSTDVSLGWGAGLGGRERLAGLGVGGGGGSWCEI
jgi:hypothetical protein